MVAWNLVMSIGIGLAFAAMPNLIVEAVPPEETGQATGVNTLVRSVGASLGSQVTRRRPGRQRRRRRAADRRRLHRRVPRQRRRRARSRRSPPSLIPQPPRPHGRRSRAPPGGMTAGRRAARAPTPSATASASSPRPRRCSPRRARRPWCRRSPRAPASARAPSTAASRPRTTSSPPSRSERVRWFEREARAAPPRRTTRGQRSARSWSASPTPTARDRGMVASMSQAIELPELVEARAAATTRCAG